MKIPKFRFFGKVNDGTMRMIDVDSIDFENGFIYYHYRHCTAEGDSHTYGDVIGFEDGILMQSTGLKDRNGVEIFEGDAIEVKRLIGPRFLVKKHEKTTQFFLQEDFVREYFGTFGQDELEVIGNIYENPEFLVGE